MRRVLMLAGAVLICAGPALAADVTVEKETTTTTQAVPVEPPQSGSTAATIIVAPEAPPPPRVEVRPAPPHPDMVWQEGHWEWNPQTHTYSWTHGDFAEPPRPRAMWSPGHWQQRPGGWVWMPGGWS